jgi:LysM repeat protein
MLANPTLNNAKRVRRSFGPLILVSGVLVLALIAAMVCGWLMAQTVATFYAHRMYPNVYVMGMKLGRLTVDEATALLEGAAHQAETGTLILDDGESRWSIPWADAGMHLDVQATVKAAFAVGHTGDLGWRERAREWLSRTDVSPILSVEPERARQVLLRLAPVVAVAPTDATLHLPQSEVDPVVALPGQPGRELDIDASLARLLALAAGVAEGQSLDTQAELIFASVAPHLTDVSPMQAQVEAMLQRRIQVSTLDVRTDRPYYWTLGRGDFITWLRLMDSADGPAVTVDRGAIQATLAELAGEVGDGFGLRWTEAVEQVADAFQAGGGTVTLYLSHPERAYTVQAGDSLSGIAAAFGMTPWHVMHANPDVDPDWLQIGQQLTIPSQDELTPYLPIPGKRVVVSIADQRMRAYKDGELVYDWPISTGMAESPTHTGVFQVLSKEENAYASLWDLWMPHFIAIYEAGPGFHNGFHGLPTLSSGRRLWEGLLGSPASYGCIILGLEEAETLYEWAEVGVVVVVE